MTYNFCTLFDKNYLYKGLALYYSIRDNCSDFRLWILCMDDASFNILQEMSLVNVELIPLKRMEDEKLLSVKQIRNAGEYSWTTKPYLVLYIFEKYPSAFRLIFRFCPVFRKPQSIPFLP